MAVATNVTMVVARAHVRYLVATLVITACHASVVDTAPGTGGSSAAGGAPAATVGSGGAGNGSSSSASSSSAGTGGANPCGPATAVGTTMFLGDVMVQGFASDGTDLFVGYSGCFWNTAPPGAIVRMPVSGGTSTHLTDLIPHGVALDASNVYFSMTEGAGGAGSISTVPKAGGAVTVLANDASPDAVAVDGANVCWLSGSSVFCTTAQGGAITTVYATTNYIQGIQVVGDSVFTMEATGSNVPKHLLRTPVVGGQPTVLATSDAYAFYARADETYFWANQQIAKVPTNGGVVVTLQGSTGDESAVIADDQCVYWLASGVVKRMPIRGGAAPSDFYTSTRTPLVLEEDASAVYVYEQGEGLDTGCPAFIERLPK